MSVLAPRPDDLDREPQLAVLFALDAALVSARAALCSCHATLRDGEPLGRVRADDPYGVIAAAIVVSVDALAEQLYLYAALLGNQNVRALLDVYTAIDDADF